MMMHALYLSEDKYNEDQRERNPNHVDRYCLHSLWVNYKQAEAMGEWYRADNPMTGYYIESDLDIKNVKWEWYDNDQT